MADGSGEEVVPTGQMPRVSASLSRRSDRGQKKEEEPRSRSGRGRMFHTTTVQRKYRPKIPTFPVVCPETEGGGWGGGEGEGEEEEEGKTNGTTEQGEAGPSKRIEDKLQLIPFQDPEEYMFEYYSMNQELTKEEMEEMATEERVYARYFGAQKHSLLSCSLLTNTTLSPMHFTHCTPGIKIKDDHTATTGASLQIFSFKIAEIKANLKWPLYVYGVVAARDKVDYNRNILFNRTRDNAQKVTEDDPFLRLTGPARAILAKLVVEVELRVKGRAKYRDRVLINDIYPYSDNSNGPYTVPFWNCLCRCELGLEQLGKSVQATILGVRIIKGLPCTFKYGGRVYFSSPAHEVVLVDDQGTAEVFDPVSTRVVLLDSRYRDDGKMPMGSDGYLDLTRHVVCVELQESDVLYPEKLEETFKVVIEAYSESGNGNVAAQGHVKLAPKLCNISHAVCDLGDSEVEITVAWSVHVASKEKL